MDKMLSNIKDNLNNPLDTIEEMVVDNSWPHNRVNENILYVEISGQWCDYFLSLAWSQDSNLLQYACTYNMNVPRDKHDYLYNLINKINCDLCFGHFELWSDDGWIIYRNSFSANNDKNVEEDQILQIFSHSIFECDKYYPAFQFLIFEGKSPKEAIAASMLKTIGDA